MMMKKLLACGLILSTLMSFGSVCFAGKVFIDDDSDDSEIEIDYPSSEDEDDDDYIGEIVIGSQDRKETKKPRRPRKDKEERSAIKLKDRKELTYLRNQAMELLSTGFGFAYNFVYYSHQEIAEMKLGDLNGDHTVLTVGGESEELPECVVEALEEYLAKRAELAPGTMGEEKPLFIACKRVQSIKQGLPMTRSGVELGIRKYRKATGQIADMEEE